VKSIPRSRACPTKTLHNKEEVDEYVDDLRARLLKALEENDAVRLGD
jgi:cell division septum initiation protein DivIVA